MHRTIICLTWPRQAERERQRAAALAVAAHCEQNDEDDTARLAGAVRLLLMTGSRVKTEMVLDSCYGLHNEMESRMVSHLEGRLKVMGHL